MHVLMWVVIGGDPRNTKNQFFSRNFDSAVSWDATWQFAFLICYIYASRGGFRSQSLDVEWVLGALGTTLMGHLVIFSLFVTKYIYTPILGIYA